MTSIIPGAKGGVIPLTTTHTDTLAPTPSEATRLT